MLSVARTRTVVLDPIGQYRCNVTDRIDQHENRNNTEMASLNEHYTLQRDTIMADTIQLDKIVMLRENQGRKFMLLFFFVTFYYYCF